MKLNYREQFSFNQDRPKQLVIFLHGYGANGDDLISLADFFQSTLPEAVFISPDAPFECENQPFGRQWFSLKSHAAPILNKEIKATYPILNEFIDDMLIKYDLEDKDLILIGFSQGAMMALYTGIRREHKPAALVSYSGALIGKELLPFDKKSAPEILLIHGSDDSVVKVDETITAAKAFCENKIPAEYYIFNGLAHNIDLNVIEATQVFLDKILKIHSNLFKKDIGKS